MDCRRALVLFGSEILFSKDSAVPAAPSHPGPTKDYNLLAQQIRGSAIELCPFSVPAKDLWHLAGLSIPCDTL